MKKIILGKSSNYLSFCLDVLCGPSYNKYTFDVVKNLPDDQETHDVPYLIPNRIIKEYDHQDYHSFVRERRYVLGVYSPKSKRSVYEFFLDRYHINTENYLNTFASNVVLPHVYSIGHGCFINYNCVISAYTMIHNFVSINRNCSIGHHCILHDFVTISPGTNIAGHCEIGEHTFIGIGTTILNNITIGKNVIIGAGSVVTKNIPDNTVYYGSPAKYVKNNL
jgi:sugar O-acyltransferase (sialic acid O-acetyltransferase NeuD family)